MNGELRALARGLGNALLAGPWEPDVMLERAAGVLGARRRWLRPVIRQGLGPYPRRPADRPRELAAFIAGCEQVGRAVAKAPAGRPARARWIPAAPTRMA